MTNEEALKKFLLDIDCLNELLPWAGKFNLFDVLRISRTEIRHSNMLAWLLNANENHGMGDAYVKALVQKLVANDSAGRYDVFQLALMDFYSFTVQREWSNIDILLTSSEEKTLIAFENKVGAHEHSDQLNRYRKILEKAYPDYCRIYLYLTPDGELPSDEEYWDVMTYLDIVETLESVSGGIDLIPDVRLMIDNYIAIIRRDIVDDQQLIEICDKIYKKHQKALDLIFEHRVNNRGQIAAAVRETLQQMSDEGSIVFDANSTDSWLCFHTKEMDAVLPPLSANNGSWGNSNIYNYWFGRTDESLSLVFELGGWNLPEDRKKIQNKIIDIAKPNDKKREDYRYKRVYSKKYGIDTENDLQTEVREQVTKAIADLKNWEKKLLIKLQQN
ncbi:PDDEXK-like family protein [Gemmiger formicilis]|uniref:PDDEXK-like family protein n=2 Tax=Gemmiger TaxID=204475 RepID=UPI00351F8AE9